MSDLEFQDMIDDRETIRKLDRVDPEGKKSREGLTPEEIVANLTREQIKAIDNYGKSGEIGRFAHDFEEK